MTAHQWTTVVTSEQAKSAALYLHQARETAVNGNEWPSSKPRTTDDTLAVIGAGTMGTGIAQCALAAGLTTHLIDAHPEALERGVRKIRNSLGNAVRKGKLTQAMQDQRLSRLHAHTNWQAVQNCDVVIEAVFESMPIKQEVMAQLHQACPAHTLLISNTSTLDIDALARASSRPGQTLGMHFLTPAHVTPLVEIVKGQATSEESLGRARQLATRFGKLPILTGNAWGFIGNRMFEGYLREVDALQLQGVRADRIDAVMESFGFVLGPCKTLDMAGTDLVSQVLAERGQQFPQSADYRCITRRLAELGRFGHKSQRGHYLYTDQQHQIDPDLQRVCAEEARRFNTMQQPNVADEAIVQRCIQPLVDEGRLLLDQGLACRASDIDLVWVLGYGFPAQRGGPMYMSKTV